MILKYFSSILLMFLSSTNAENSTLQLVHVFFRHGSRTPVHEEIYPNDPYLKLWEKMGIGELTTIGKLQSFQLGSMIKKRYQHFLSADFDSEEITVKWSNSNRTIQTAMLVLEGMFSTFNTGSKLDSFLFTKDHVFKHPSIYCPAYITEYFRYTTTPNYLKYESQYNDLFKIITQSSNKIVNRLYETFYLYHYAHSVKYINLIVPEWIERIYDRLRDVAIATYLTQANTRKLKRLNGGNMVKDAIKNMRTKTKKMVLVSCHDVNIISMIVTMNIFKPHIPDYNAALFIELHFDEILQYYVKIFYSSHIYKEPQELFIEDCGYPCQLGRFEKIVQPYLPRNYTGECEANVLLDDDDAHI